ncbi:hypothetical protein [Roseateles flavus]|uniref:Arginase n=1 Tax=Roseateles flavus TaxID=3149041 RepID=A0ABV0GKC4_9BURK
MLRDFTAGDPQQTAAGSGYCAPYLYLLADDAAEERSQRTVHTKRKLGQVTRAIRDGRGQGRGDGYSPWIRITRRFSSPVSNQEFTHLPIHRRSHHFLSTLESHTALQLAYLGASELRECLPMWPTPHANPITDEARDEVPGLIEIAESAGIEHGVFVGSDVPYIGSLDIMAAIDWAGTVHQVGISCKPTDVLNCSPRAQERVDLDRRYCAALGVRHLHEGGDGFDRTLVKQLEAYRPLRSEVVAYRDTQQLLDFCGHFEGNAASMPMHVAIDLSGSRVHANHDEASLLWRVGVWLRLIDIDLARPLSMCKPIVRGRDRVLSQLAQRFLGEAA